MKLSNPVFLLAAMVLTIGGLAYFSTRTVTQETGPVEIEPTSTRPVEARAPPVDRTAEYTAAASTLNAARARWDDSLKLAKVTPRIQLASVVSGMQQQAHDLDALTPTLPGCMQDAAKHLRASQQASLDMLLAFMGSDMEALVQSTKADPEPPMRSFETALAGCRPS